jgi:protocatechuate 4,5-dioxygenase alpha subunit
VRPDAKEACGQPCDDRPSLNDTTPELAHEYGLKHTTAARGAARPCPPYNFTKKPLKQSERDFANPLPGSYLLTVSLAQQAYRLSAFCRGLMKPENRQAFKADELRCLQEAGLDEAEIAMVRARDWLAMVRYGVNHFLVFRLAGVVGEGLVAAGAQMRGETLEQFAGTRRVWEGRR